MKPGILFIVATPIGNYEDITHRAEDVLAKADAVICEEFREASTLLKKLGISGKQLLQLNEHNEVDAAEELVLRLLNGENLALISDCGTPAFADPGTYLIRRCFEMEISVTAVPGASSLMTAISLSPLPLDDFHFAGFLPRKEEQRRSKFQWLKRLDTSIILMDTPYRLVKLLDEVMSSFGPGRLVTLAVDMTMENEMVLHGSIQEIKKKVNNRKGEFILIIHQNR